MGQFFACLRRRSRCGCSARSCQAAGIPSDANIEHSLIVSCNAADDLTGLILALSPKPRLDFFLFGTDERSGWSGW